jgi:hypothetical protein
MSAGRRYSHKLGFVQLAAANFVAFAPRTQWQVFFKTSNLTYVYLCQLSISASECSHTLSPISRFQDDELKDLIHAMENRISRYAIPIHHLHVKTEEL